jgi:hypothetical protein
MRRFEQRKPVQESSGQLDRPMDVDDERQDENQAPFESLQESDIGVDQIPPKPSMPPQIRPDLAELPFVLLARNPLRWVDENRVDGWALTKSGQWRPYDQEDKFGVRAILERRFDEHRGQYEWLTSWSSNDWADSWQGLECVRDGATATTRIWRLFEKTHPYTSADPDVVPKPKSAPRK